VFQPVDEFLAKGVGVLDFEIGAVDFKYMIGSIVEAAAVCFNRLVEQILVIEYSPPAEKII